MKTKIIFILIIQFSFITNCKIISKKKETKDIIYEELALKYFNDSIINDKRFSLKGKNFFYDGLVTGNSIYSHSPYEMYHTRKYKMAIEFQESHLNNNVKDFYIKVPSKIKKITLNNFKKIKNENNYFLNVKHHITSKKRIFIVIDLINKQGVTTNNVNILLNKNGLVKDWEEEAILTTIYTPKNNH